MSATENCVTQYTCNFFVILVYQICNAECIRQISIWSISDIHVVTRKVQCNDALCVVNCVVIMVKMSRALWWNWRKVDGAKRPR